MKEVTVAIINYNTRDDLRRCLESIPDEVREQPLKVLVIDNASPDGSASMVSDEFGQRKGVTLLANRANLGFARAVNQALAHSSTRYLLVLNADTEVVEGSIEALHDFMEQHPRTGVAGAKLLDAEGNLQYSCRTFYSLPTILLRRTPLGGLMPRHRALRDHLMMDWDHADARTVDWMQGACLMLRREAMDEVGGMDERFFLYFEDVDLCRRMARRGWEVTYVPQATFIHHYKRGSHRGLVSMEKVHHLASGLRFWAKWNLRAARLAAVLKWLAPLLVLALDLALINLGFMLCLQLRDVIAGELPYAATDHSSFLPILAGTNTMLVVAFGSAGLYRVDRSKDWLAVSARAIRAITWVALAGMVLLFFAPGYRHGLIYSRLTFLLYYLLLVVTVPVGRLFIRLFLRACWRRHLLLKRTVVVGEARHADRLAESIRAEPLCGYQVAAVLATSAPSDARHEDRGREAPSFKQLMEDQRPAGVIFVARNRSVRSFVPDLLYCFKRNVEVRVATNHDFLPLIHARAGKICGEPAADVSRPPFYPIKRSLKRISDLVLTGIAVVAAAPLLLLLAVLIRLQDGGPAFFVQERVGKNGRTFGMFKLRTMKVDTGEIDLDAMANIAEGPLTMIPNDPRVTPLGRWLRRHKLDELPQLVNVLAGQMSLVGPRPPTTDEVQQYTPWQQCRLAVRPGITGLWQIDKERKWRFDEMVELDLQYILNWSLLLDYSVMLRTVPVVVRGT